jgi:hypothetical protein
MAPTMLAPLGDREVRVRDVVDVSFDLDIRAGPIDMAVVRHDVAGLQDLVEAGLWRLPGWATRCACVTLRWAR